MPTAVRLSDGTRGVLDPNSPYADAAKGLTLLRLDDGWQVLVPQSALLPQPDGSFLLPVRVDELKQNASPSAPVGASAEDTLVMPAPQAETVIPLVEETLRVDRQAVETGRVRVSKTVSEREETVDEPLLQQEVSVERVPVNRAVTETPGQRWEGDTLVIPLLEEVLVVEKRLMLKEEIRITRTQTQTHQPQQVLLRSEEAVIERVAPTETTSTSDTTPT